ncbi:conserved hypothetical protein [Talaromyces stipitatus ATCC 10500]|uniref:CorA family metal ion transporter n=1 Tax=Talaromyces stipitatus (strain ATCC 10500 / CBS 375.48 / QM 6759 / NRRL 1006) TaxID=441959 RepID=B8M215_TALSN|nr:uncharacterized protein TSTA_086240 [Talaromyces stipitatus ATCC 10500]EED21393.1 conserved hypothetical protein [Talaromyces stipitatus ATCC 10500]
MTRQSSSEVQYYEEFVWKEDLFANASDFEDQGQNPTELCSFFPPSFWRIVKEDLNGAFGLERHEGTSELAYGVSLNSQKLSKSSIDMISDAWSTFKMKHVYKEEDSGEIEYNWSQVSVLTRQSKTKQLVLFIDSPPAVVDQIVRDCLLNTSRSVGLASHVSSAFHDPFIWHALLIGALETEYEKDYWNLRNIVRGREKGRDGEPDFPLLHDLGRHLIHAKEIFDVAINTIDSIMHHHQSLYGEFRKGKALGIEEQTSRERLHNIIQEKLYISEKDMTAKKARAISLNERHHNEINLGYHVVTQKANQLSIDIARIARRDNATMKALALIGVLYLPGTFISGIFGSNFFNYNPPNNDGSADWRMSDKFWIYWVITIPVTIFTVMLWAMLDETVMLYKKFIGIVEDAMQKWWDDLAIFNKRRDAEEEYDIGGFGANTDS